MREKKEACQKAGFNVCNRGAPSFAEAVFSHPINFTGKSIAGFLYTANVTDPSATVA